MQAEGTTTDRGQRGHVRQASAPALLVGKRSAGHGTTTRTAPRRSMSLDASVTRPSADLGTFLAAAHTLQRAVSGFLGVPMSVPTVLCPICFENVPVDSTIGLKTCGHRFCGPCLKRYLELKIVEGSVFPVCFHPVEPSQGEGAQANRGTTCGKQVEDAQLQAIVDRDIWAKCTLFRFNKANATARECPFCFHPQDCTNGPKNPECTCEKCDRVFCFLHGNAHVNGTCADYELKHAESETQSRATIARVAKPCPGCKSNVEKSGGCNHMTCVVCRTDFCWICNTTLENGRVSDHFSSATIGGCGGRQFDDVDIDGRRSLWSRFSQVHSFLYLQIPRQIYRVMHYVVYPLAFALALLIFGAMRVRPIQAIASTPFPELIEWTRFFIAGVAAFATFVYMVSQLPEPASQVFIYTQQVKALGDLAIFAWPWVQSRLLDVRFWIRAHVRNRFHAVQQDPELERLVA